MKNRDSKKRFRPALTLLELVLAMVMVTIIFAAVLPQFAMIGNNWDSKQGTAEALQNGRVFIDDISRNLSKAKYIIAVSDSSAANGYIEFTDNGVDVNRYDIHSGNNYIEYGPVGALADLAGPVSSLKFACYDACNLDTALSPVTDVNVIRTIKIDAAFTNSASMGQTKTFTSWAYLRSNGIGTAAGSWHTLYDYTAAIQDINVFAYKSDSAGGSTPPANLVTPADSSVFNPGEYDKIEADDGSFQEYAASQSGRYAIMRFKIFINESKSLVSRIDVIWNGKGINAKSSAVDGSILYIWNYAADSYEQLQLSANTEAEITLTGTINSNVTNYIGGTGQNTISVLVSSADKRSGSSACELYTDYIKAEVIGQNVGIYP